MRKVTVALLVGLCALCAGPLAADDESAIKYRQSVMKAAGGHAGALGAIAKGQVSHTSHIPVHAQAVKGLSMQVLDAFKQEAVSEKSRAKTEIWSDWAGFEKAASRFETASAKLAEAAGGKGDMGAAMKELFGSCKGCHKDYRKKKKQ